MNEPPDQTAEFSAANLLSPGGITVAQCSRNEVRVLAQGRVGVQKMTPLSSRSLRMEW